MTLAIPFPQIDPVLIEIGPLAIRWYALAYMAGLLLGWFALARLLSNQRIWPAGPNGGPPMSRTDLDDLLLWVTLAVVFGGRIGYVLFYNLPYYVDHPLAALAVWRGGMSFHGGLLGVAIALVIFGARRGINVFRLADAVALVVPIGLFFGRIANFINAELWGRPSDVPWAVVFPGAGPVPRHPSQLYEAALEGLLLFAILWFLAYRTRMLARPGLSFGVFLAGYGALRIVAEYFREPDAHIGFLAETPAGGLTMGILLSIPLVIAGLAAIANALAAPARG